jgi:hypothetical protein
MNNAKDLEYPKASAITEMRLTCNEIRNRKDKANIADFYCLFLLYRRNLRFIAAENYFLTFSEIYFIRAVAKARFYCLQCP